MGVTLQIIIGIIVGSWLIALCFKNFRNRCEEDLPDLLLEFHRMYKEDDTNGIFYKVFAFIAIYFIVYPIIIAIIIVSPMEFSILLKTDNSCNSFKVLIMQSI